MINKDSQGFGDSKKANQEIWQRCYRKDPNIVFRKIADKVILVPIRHKIGDLESIYALNETAARIWELIDGKRSVGRIKELIVEEFEVSCREAETDIIQLIGQLQDIGGINNSALT